MRILKRRSDAIYLTEMGAFIARRITGVADDVQLSVKWGNSQDQQCTAHITLNSEHHAVSPTGIHYLSATCQQEPQNVK
ncbi:TPA: hypothetical protein I8562_001492 [Citrobacter koseri]|nr:hypothetical protein [Citrobacter koseri]